MVTPYDAADWLDAQLSQSSSEWATSSRSALQLQSSSGAPDLHVITAGGASQSQGLGSMQNQLAPHPRH